MADRGRPTTYNGELIYKILEEVSLGKSMRRICEADGMPAPSTVFKWLAENKDFSDQYARAKEEAADYMVEELIEIADDGTNDWMEKLDDKGKVIGWTLNGEHVQRSRVRIDTRKWIASKLKPRKYSERFDITSGDKPIPILGGVVKLPSDDDISTDDSA